MSIIYDALKKSGDNNPDRERKPPLSPDAEPVMPPKIKKEFDTKKLLIPLAFVIVVGFFVYHMITSKNNPNHSRTKHTAASKSSSGTKHESPRPAPVVKNYSSSSLILEGIIYDEAKPLAIINGKVLKPGDSVNDATIESITATKVILRKNGTTQELSM